MFNEYLNQTLWTVRMSWASPKYSLFTSMMADQNSDYVYVMGRLFEEDVTSGYYPNYLTMFRFNGSDLAGSQAGHVHPL